MIPRPAVLLLAFLAAGCATTRAPKDYSAFRAASPRSILVVPVVNETNNVEAPGFFLSTIPIPVAERGYYVFPTYLVSRLLEDDGLADANLVHQADPVRVCGLFGADAVLYVTIRSWVAKYVVLSTSVEVEFDYVLKDGKTGDTLWSEHRRVVQSSGSSSSGSPLVDLVAMAVAAAVTKASPNYMPLARQANASVIGADGVGLLPGPYAPKAEAAGSAAAAGGSPGPAAGGEGTR